MTWLLMWLLASSQPQTDKSQVRNIELSLLIRFHFWEREGHWLTLSFILAWMLSDYDLYRWVC